jgi:hypothetical protein
VIPAQFSLAYAFKDGLALFATWKRGLDGERLRPYGYVDTSGRVVWQADR